MSNFEGDVEKLEKFHLRATKALGHQGGVVGHWTSVSNEGAGLVQSGKEELSSNLSAAYNA